MQVDEPIGVEPQRPVPHSGLRAWLDWVGVSRALTIAAVVVAMVVGGYWLLRPTPLPVETRIPITSVHPSATVTTLPAVVVVDVAGAVLRPGVYRLPAGARVTDLIDAAGGARADAAVGLVNLARPLADGERVYVPTDGETVVSSAGSTDPGPVHINTADAGELDRLPGVGPTTAAAIMAYRDAHGPFTSVDQLADVPGIGPAKLDAIRQMVSL